MKNAAGQTYRPTPASFLKNDSMGILYNCIIIKEHAKNGLVPPKDCCLLRISFGHISSVLQEDSFVPGRQTEALKGNT